MGILLGGDEELHYSDSSHRWVAPPEIEQNAWTASLRVHQAHHRQTMGGPPELDEPGPPAPHIPREGLRVRATT